METTSKVIIPHEFPLSSTEEFASVVHNKGIDPDFTTWGDKTESKSFHKEDFQEGGDTHLPNIKDDRVFDENPLFAEEDNERLPTDTFNDRETTSKFVIEEVNVK